MNWYYVENGKQAGPVEETQLIELVHSSVITPQTLVWREGMQDWQPFANARPDLAFSGPSGPTPVTTLAADEVVCSECNQVFRREETIGVGSRRICASCKPMFIQKLREGAPLQSTSLRYAGFWIRVAAKLVDGLILAAVFILPIVFLVMQAQEDPDRFQVLQILFQLGYMAINIGFNAFFIGKYGATPGKMLCRLRVVLPDGGRVTYARATGRAFAEILSGMICYIGYIIVAFDQQKRALHDHICNTRVVYK